MLIKEVLRIKGNNLISVTPATPLSEALATMADRDIGSLVVMEGTKLVGMLTFREVLRAVRKAGARFETLEVGAVMVRNPTVVGPDMEVDELRRVMIDVHCRYVPVRDGDALVGVLSFHDVAKAVLEEQGFENKLLKGYIKNWPA
jgi:CBS domain-containing protein